MTANLLFAAFCVLVAWALWPLTIEYGTRTLAATLKTTAWLVIVVLRPIRRITDRYFQSEGGSRTEGGSRHQG